jgi:hypothetical protein
LKLTQAYRWGIKAAQAAMSPTSNPYRNAAARASWEAGYASERFAALRPSKLPVP